MVSNYNAFLILVSIDFVSSSSFT